MKGITARRERLRELIESERFDAQEDIIKRLNSEGFPVTQPTLSRDFREMGISRENGEGGVYYRFKFARKNTDNFFLGSIISVKCAAAVVVITCESGTASAVCTLIDKLMVKHIAGTIAGDDTIFAACESEKTAKYVAAEIKKYARL
jgi:transcriptional regulator of arginine metabolism